VKLAVSGEVAVSWTLGEGGEQSSLLRGYYSLCDHDGCKTSLQRLIGIRDLASTIDSLDTLYWPFRNRRQTQFLCVTSARRVGGLSILNLFRKYTMKVIMGNVTGNRFLERIFEIFMDFYQYSFWNISCANGSWYYFTPWVKALGSWTWDST
jgi:hypothetical protein